MELIDKALIRPGRFDRQIYVGFPEREDRVELFNLYLNRVAHDDTNVDVQELARCSSGFSAAEIANVCNDAAILAATKGEDVVKQEHLLQGIEKVRQGLDFGTKLANNVTFDDVAGVKKSKGKILQIVDFFTDFYFGTDPITQRTDYTRVLNKETGERVLPNEEAPLGPSEDTMYRDYVHYIEGKIDEDENFSKLKFIGGNFCECMALTHSRTFRGR